MKSKRDKLKDFDIIQSYFTGERDESDLTPHQTERLRRLRLCVSLLLDAQPHFQIVGKMMTVFGISQATAYNDMAFTRKLFGTILKGNKEMWRAMAVEMALSDRRAAIRDNNHKARSSATKNFIEASGIKNEDPDLPDFGKLAPSLIINLLPEGMEKKIESLLDGGAIDLNEMPETIDIPHQIVEDKTQKK